MLPPWTYYQAVAFFAYGSVEVAARYGGRDNEHDGGKGRRAADLFYPLRSGLPGIDAVLAIKDPNERDIALHGTKTTKAQWHGVGVDKNKPGERECEYRNRVGWEAADEERWLAGVKELYQAMLSGSVTAYRGTAAYAPNSLVEPVAADAWKRGLDGVERCYFEGEELLAWAQDHVTPECFEPTDPSAFEQFQARIAALRSFTILDAKARIVYGAAYDERYATLPGDRNAEREAQHRRRRDKRYGSGSAIAMPLVGSESPGGTIAGGVSNSRVTPSPKPQGADHTRSSKRKRKPRPPRP